MNTVVETIQQKFKRTAEEAFAKVNAYLHSAAANA